MKTISNLVLPDHLADVTEAADGITLATAPQGWFKAAEAASRAYGGQFWPIAGGITWLYGRRRQTYLDHEYWPIVDAARGLCRQVPCEPGHTLGSCARHMLDWVVPDGAPTAPRTNHTGRTRIARGHTNYHDCQPGRYDHAVMYDISSAYFSLLSRAPSLAVDIIASRPSLIWHPMGRNEQRRFGHILSVVGANKVLRNTLVGCLDGGEGKRLVWCKGERRVFGLQPGPFPALAALIRRSCWELTRAASEDTDSVYSNVDCIVTLGREPEIWRSCGLNYQVHASGDADICAGACYRVGEHATEAYKTWHRRIGGKKRADRPSFEWFREWLT